MTQLLFTFIAAVLLAVGKLKLIPLYSKSAKNQNSRKIEHFILQNNPKQVVPYKSTAEEVSFEWSHHNISCADSKS